MDAQEFAMHLAAGKHYGQASACGAKIRHGSEERAASAARVLNGRHLPHKVEAYPCYWCNDWHVGREMTEEERSLFTKMEGQER